MSAHAPEAAGKGTDALLVQIGISSRKSCLKWLLLLGLQCTWTVWTVMLIRNKEEVHIALYCHVSRVTSHVTNLGSLLFLIRTLPRSTASQPATSPPGHSPPGHQRGRPACRFFLFWATSQSLQFILSEYCPIISFFMQCQDCRDPPYISGVLFFLQNRQWE